MLRLLLLLLAIGTPLAATADGFLVRGARIIDGTGSGAVRADVRVRDGRIAAIGMLEPQPGESVIDGRDRVLAPGFIDTHSHADEGLQRHRDARRAVAQGITTAVVGQDGGSPWPLNDWFQQLEAAPVALNIASYAGHNTLRSEVMGDDFRRPATAGEIEAMGALLQRELAAGALGLAGGLEYEPGIHAEPGEVLALARLAAAVGGRFIAHIRSEDRWFWQAIEEIIDIGRVTGMPVQVSHMKLAQKSHWGRANELLARLDAARADGIDITADVYPYTYWQSNMMVLIPSRDLSAREEYAYALEEIAPPDGFWLTRFEPEPALVGQSLSTIAATRDTDPVTALMQLTAEAAAWEAQHGGSADMMIGTSMTEADVRALLAWPHSNVCTDGGLDDLHPRGTGTYPRVLGRYVREDGLFPLETAVHKMTGLAARHMGLTDRGRIAVGLAADLVLFDPDTVIDHATPTDPQAPNSGIDRVWVNGQVVWQDGAPTGLHPGRVLRREAP